MNQVYPPWRLGCVVPMGLIVKAGNELNGGFSVHATFAFVGAIIAAVLSPKEL
jgi:hypothetical protein